MTTRPRIHNMEHMVPLQQITVPRSLHWPLNGTNCFTLLAEASGCGRERLQMEKCAVVCVFLLIMVFINEVPEVLVKDVLFFILKAALT